MWAAVAVAGIGSAGITFYGRFLWALRVEIAGSHRRGNTMLDLIYVLIAVGSFAAAWGFCQVCGRL